MFKVVFNGNEIVSQMCPIFKMDYSFSIIYYLKVHVNLMPVSQRHFGYGASCIIVDSCHFDFACTAFHCALTTKFRNKL